MTIALTPDELSFVKKHIVRPLEKCNAEVFAFGSRAIGTNNKFSDLDILVKSKNVTQVLRDKLGEINEFMIESSFPYKVDLVLEVDMAESYKKSIEKQLLKI